MRAVSAARTRTGSAAAWRRAVRGNQVAPREGDAGVGGASCEDEASPGAGAARDEEEEKATKRNQAWTRSMRVLPTVRDTQRGKERQHA
eukprot:3136982-Amphidinium_carterae.2